MEKNGLDYPFTGAADFLSKPDLTAGNLETPLTSRGTAAQGKEYVFRGKPEYAMPLKKAGFDVVTVANNHTLDQGTEGLLDTMRHLDEAELPHVGGGRNDSEAFAPVILTSRGITTAYIGVSRVLPVGEWKAEKNRVGVAEAYNSTRAVSAVKAAKGKADLVVVMVHWGVERSDQPVAEQKKLARELIDAGADLVIGSHPACAARLRAVQGQVDCLQPGQLHLHLQRRSPRRAIQASWTPSATRTDAAGCSFIP